ncbi:MAG: hypothetical protein ABWX94_01625 [Candidatus Saccharimonadales bacterium]
MSAELTLPQGSFMEQDRVLADMIGLPYDSLAELTQTHVHDLGSIVILGTNDEVPVMRFHTGPDDSIKRGGTKFKFYSEEELLVRDGIDHGRSMFFKIGAIGKTGLSEREYAAALTSSDPEAAIMAGFKAVRDGYGGGKTIAGVDHRRYAPEQNIDALKQVARRMHEKGLTNPEVDGTAGDEGTGNLLDHYVDELRAIGHPHPEAAITGKRDMSERPAATGRGSAMSHRARMQLLNQTTVRSAIQGFGAAGSWYGAEAYDPLNSDDRKLEIVIPAIGDLQFNRDGSRTPITLHTEHPDGLPITRRMIAELDDPNDVDMREVGGNRVLALARKVEAVGREVRVSEKDVLTFENADYLVPAATSNVFTPDNVGNISIKNWLEVGNHTVRDDARPFLDQLGVTLVPGEVVNAGGVMMSTEENLRDLRRIHTQATGLYLPEVTSETYNDRLRTTMTRSTQQMHAVAKEFGVDLQTAANVVGLASYAVSRDMKIDSSVRDLLAA